MVDAKALRENQEKNFNEKFDFVRFDEFINKTFSDSRNLSVNVGLEMDFNFKGDGLVSFVKGKKNGYWQSNCQIPQEAVPHVKKYLEANGFKTNMKGVAGFDKFDVLIVSLY